MQSITNALSDWLRHVPNDLRIDFANLDTHLNRECVSISLHFYSCVNMTARPLVFYVIKRQLDAEAQGSAPEDWKDGLSQSAVGVIDSCITAARATTLILDAAAKHNRIGMSLIHLYSKIFTDCCSNIRIFGWRVCLFRCSVAGNGQRSISTLCHQC